MGEEEKKRWWVWALLVAALFAVSSAATGLKLMTNVPPLLKASWRLQSSSFLLFFFFLIHLYKMLRANESNKTEEFSPETRKRYFSFNTMAYMGVSGTALAIHFGCWVASLDYTSLAHSLLLVTCHPILIVLGSVVLRQPISKGEIIGGISGFAGLAFTLVDTFVGSDSGSSSGEGGDSVGVVGDVLAFMGAIAIIAYLYIGKRLRSWVSLYLYAFPVTFLSSVLLAIASLILEKEFFEYGLFGYFSKEYIVIIVYLAIVPGFIGHTGINAIIKYVEPVVISVTLLIEPVIGSFIGYFFHQSSLPSLFTFLGGPIIIIACIIVTISAYRRTQTQTPKINHNDNGAEEYEKLDRNNEEGTTTSEDDIREDNDNNEEKKQTSKYSVLRDSGHDIELDEVVHEKL